MVSEYDQEIPQSQTADWPIAPEGEPHNNHETPARQSKQEISSLFPIKMIAKLEGKLRNVQQNIEQLQNPTMGVTINNKSTT